MSKTRECNRAKAPRFPNRTALSKQQSIRSVLKLGRSHGVTLPARWLRAVYDPARPFLVCTINPDGTITIAPLASLAPAADPATAPDPHDCVSGSEERKAGT